MTQELLKDLTTAISIQIGCIDKPYINGFAGTGKSRKRDLGTLHTIARKITERALVPYSFQSGDLPASETEIHTTVHTALYDIDDEDARRWGDRTQWDIARHEAARDIAKALLRNFRVEKRVLDTMATGFGGAHNLSNFKFEGE